MLKDLQSIDPPELSLNTDVVVIGGGIAGLVLATRLARHSVRTIVLESGGAAHVTAPDPLNAVIQIGQAYNGAAEGRYRGLGGTSQRWGGAMLPFKACDMGEHTAGWPIDWPVSIDSIERHFAEIEALFRLPAGPFELNDRATQDGPETKFVLRSAKWPSFRLRNVANALRKQIAGDGLEIWLNATVTRFFLDARGRLAAVQAEAPSGKKITVNCRVAVLAAGAIESTRLMLLLDRQHDSRVFGPRRVLGHYFFDHLSSPVATVEPVDRRSLNETFGMRFERSGMRDVRIEPSASLRRAAQLPGAFARISAASDKGSSFDALRAIYRNMQSGSPVDWRNVRALTRDFGWLSKASYWRFVNGRLLAPRDSVFKLILVTEQFPNEKSTITLDGEHRDRHGNPLACINWQTDVKDIESFRALQSALLDFWDASSLRHLGSLTPVAETIWRPHLQADADIFHPGGTTRMGRDPAGGVVDANLSAFQLPNLYVVSTSVFPSGGSANPTFTLMAFALRAAEHIAHQLSGGATT